MNSERFEMARLTDSTVQRLMEMKVGPEEIIIALVEEKKVLINRVVALASIAPRKICHGEKTYVWHCPDELVPTGLQ